MAAPPNKTIHDLNGTWDMNKKISDNSTAMLKLQGIPWLVQQAANYSAVQVILKQYKDDEGKEHVDQEQISTGNMRQTEERILTGETADREVKFWGKVKGYAKFIKANDEAIAFDPYLTEGWEEGDNDLILSYVESRTDSWIAWQVWGFAEVEGLRRHVRRVISKKGSQEQRVRLVYDFKE